VPGTPAVADLFSLPVARAQFGAMISAMVFLAAGTLTGSTRAVYAGAVLFLVGVGLFVSQIVRIALGGSMRIRQIRVGAEA
jgi:hypothetical protein